MGKDCVGIDSRVRLALENVMLVVSASKLTGKTDPFCLFLKNTYNRIMFQDARDGSRESCRGEVAKDLLQKTCAEIIERVRDVDKDERKHGQASQQQDSNTEDEIATDMNTYFVPYRYSLLSRDLVVQVIPECQSNPHFQVAKSASILLVDKQLELEKAKEAQLHKPPVASSTQRGGANSKGDSTASPDPSKHQYPPGFRPSKVATSKSRLAGAGKSSMFMPSKKPSAMVAGSRPGGPGGKPVKTALHMRRKGGAQALLSKGGLKQRLAGKMGGTASNLSVRKAGGAGGLVGAAAAGRASKSLGNSHRSKMKMIDVDESKNLAKEHQAREDKLAQAQKSRKRKILDKAAERGLVSGNAIKHRKTDTSNGEGAMHVSTVNSPDGTDNNGAASVTAAIKAEEQTEPPVEPGETTQAPQQQSQFPTHPQLAAAMDIAAMTAGTAAPAAPAPPMASDPTAAQQQHQDDGNGNSQEWKIILRERSNKLSAEDRFRVKQFFEDRYNPTPENEVYKMKLHEARTTDPQSGQAIKETFYLELDYRTFTSKQSKKVKRY